MGQSFIASINKNSIAFTAHVSTAGRCLVTCFTPPDLAPVCNEAGTGQQVAGSPFSRAGCNCSAPQEKIFFKSHGPFTCYLPPCLIYAIKGSIAVCLIHAFILPLPTLTFFFNLKTQWWSIIIDFSWNWLAFSSFSSTASTYIAHLVISDLGVPVIRPWHDQHLQKWSFVFLFLLEKCKLNVQMDNASLLDGFSTCPSPGSAAL